jgi:hypothetical protein
VELDPVRYEMFLHRLWAIGEEGRLALQRVTASPIVSQGGECMSAPSASACSGVRLHDRGQGVQDRNGLSPPGRMANSVEGEAGDLLEMRIESIYLTVMFESKRGDDQVR